MATASSAKSGSLDSVLIDTKARAATALAPHASPFHATSNPFAAGSLGDLGVANPFAASASPFASAAYAGVVDVDPNAPEGTYTYTMVRSGPEVSDEEVEVPHLASIEVATVWGSNVLRVDHLTPPRSYVVGEDEGDEKTACDFFVASDMLGTTRAPIVRVSGGRAALVILRGATGTIDIPGKGKQTLAACIASGQAQPSSEVHGAHELELPAGAKARLELAGTEIAFEVSAVNAGKLIPAGLLSHFDSAASIYFALSVLLHIGLVASLALFMPHMTSDDSEAIDRDALLLMQHLLNASAEREDEKRETAENNASSPSGGTGAAAKGPEGKAGDPMTRTTGKKFAIEGPRENLDPHMASAELKREARDFGMIGLLNTALGGDPGAPTSPWGRDTALGNDPLSAKGGMWGDAMGASYGDNGLGLSGTGLSGGGDGFGAGMGDVGTIGHGRGDGIDDGFGHGHGNVGGQHKMREIGWKVGDTEVNGRLPKEVIQRVVRQNFGRFRLCYENGLRTNPGLTGRVSVKFVISRDGGVTLAQDGGSDLPDQSVVSCVVRGFGNLSFPPPQGGIVTVAYPITLTPGGDG